MKILNILFNGYIVLSCLSCVESFSLKNYPFHPRIHVLGNIGFGGTIHAKMAPYITKLIDYNAYNKRNIRNEIYKEIIKDYDNHPYILDLCCGVGLSTPDHKKCIGIDTSIEMVNEAKQLNKKYKNNYIVGNAESIYETTDFKQHFIKNYNDTNFTGFDIVTIFFAFHEMPQKARQDIILYHSKYAKHKLIIVDIDPNYKPSRSMVYGEPYLFDYKEHIKKDLYFAKEDIIINNHVIMWTFEFNKYIDYEHRI